MTRLPFDLAVPQLGAILQAAARIRYRASALAMRYARLRSLAAVLVADLTFHAPAELVVFTLQAWASPRNVGHQVWLEASILRSAAGVGPELWLKHLRLHGVTPSRSGGVLHVASEAAQGGLAKGITPLDHLAERYGSSRRLYREQTGFVHARFTLRDAARLRRAGIAPETYVAMCASPWPWVREAALTDLTVVPELPPPVSAAGDG